MGRVLFLIFLAIIIVFIMVPNMLLIDNHNDKIIMKNNLNLSARVLMDSIDMNISNIDELSEGYGKSPVYDIKIDKNGLIREFYGVLSKNILDEFWYKEIKKNIKVKILVYSDRFYICDNFNRWSPPYYFIYKYDDKPLYISSKVERAYFYEDDGSKVYGDISSFGLTLEERDELIISKLNNEISKYASDELGKSIRIKIYNPNNKDGQYKAENSSFNVLDGLTFFVVYFNNNRFNVFDNDIEASNYQVAGYTLEDY